MVAGKRTGWIVFFLGLVSLVLLVGIVDAAIDIWRANRAEAWPTANGVVIESRTRPGCSRAGKGYSTTVRYRYQVDGKDYESRRIIFGAASCDPEHFARSSMKEFPVGAEIKVRYDPQAPAEAVLIPGMVDDSTSGALAFMTLWLVLATAAAAMVLYVARTSPSSKGGHVA